LRLMLFRTPAEAARMAYKAAHAMMKERDKLER
jgi:hypothetical protein